MRIALATAAHYPELAPDDQVFFRVLEDTLRVRASVGADVVVWDAEVDWSSYDVVVTRSIWDYHLKYPRYLQWLSDLDAARCVVHNTTELQRWNADKRYMLDLQRKGVRVTPTVANPADLASVVKEHGWEKLVIKPSVASTGYETWLCDAADLDEARYREQRTRMEVLVQQFLPGIADGEISMVFLGGEYSHSVIKKGTGDEFRIHIEHGGTVEHFVPSREMGIWASEVIKEIPSPWTYARVDAVMTNDGPMLMELELLDPELFFLYNEAAAERFAGLVCK